MKKISVRCVLFLFAFEFAGAVAFAQSAQPAAKPRADAKKAPPTASSAKAQPETKGDKIMTFDELRACMTAQRANEIEASAIKRDQTEYSRDQDTLRAEQAEVKKTNDELATRAAALRAEQAAMSQRVNELRAMAEAAKTDAEKADYEKERDRLAERNRMHDQAIVRFNEAQKAQAARIDAINARIGPLNERGKTVNDRVEPLQEKVASWRSQCGNRRYREDDEIAIKKEFAAEKK